MKPSNTVIVSSDQIIRLNAIIHNQREKLRTLEEEIKRAEAMQGVATQIICNASLMLKAHEQFRNGVKVPAIISTDTGFQNLRIKPIGA